jgi:hypothetical protein
MNLSSKKFTLDVVFVRDNGDIQYIPLTMYDNQHSNRTATYNEKITEKDNGQYSLTFNIEMFVNEERNLLASYLVNDRLLRLTLDDDEVIDFVVTSRQPTFSNSGFSYAISCQDYFSYQLSKQQIDLNFSTLDEELWGGDVGPKTIDQLVNKVFEIANISNWELKQSLLELMLEFPDNLYSANGRLSVSMELSNTTPYNIFMEILKLFNAVIVLDYKTNPHSISFYNKERVTYQGLRLYPEINLSNFSYSDNGSNLYNMMHITGGEDAEGNYVSIVPEMPTSVGKLLMEMSKRNAYLVPMTITGTNNQNIAYDRSNVPHFSYEDYNVAPDFYLLEYLGFVGQKLESDGTRILEIRMDNSYAGTPIALDLLTYGDDILDPQHGVQSIPFQFTKGDQYVKVDLTLPAGDYTLRFKQQFYEIYQKPTYQEGSVNTMVYSRREVYDHHKKRSHLWEETTTIKELGQLIYDIYLTLASGVILEQANAIQHYFKDLEKIPHGASFLYNFDYWKDSGLLTTVRYNKLISLLNVDLRNINLLIAAYSKIYNKMNYELNKLIQQEEELFALMAAEDELRANYDDELDAVSLDAVYSSCCKKVAFTETVNDITKRYYNYYIDIGIVASDGFTIEYGQSVHGSHIAHQLPGMNKLEGLSLYYFDGNDTFEVPVADYEYSRMQIISDELLPAGSIIYLKYKSTKTQESILNQLVENKSSSIEMDTLTQNAIDKYLADVQTLWGESYHYYQRMVNGNSWCDKKIQEISDKQAEKIYKQNEIITNLTSLFGTNWRALDTTSLQSNISATIEYSDLTEQLNNLGVYIGGVGKRVKKDASGAVATPIEYYTYKGWYDYYLEELMALNSQKTYTGSGKALVDIMNELTQAREEWENNFYGGYYDIIRETKYSDSNQITSAGLYESAYRQFLQYSQPTKSYGASLISSESVQNLTDKVQVGDVVEILHNYLNETLLPKYVEVSLDADSIKYQPTCMVKYHDINRIELDGIERVQGMFTSNGRTLMFAEDIYNIGNIYFDTGYAWTSDNVGVLIESAGGSGGDARNAIFGSEYTTESDIKAGLSLVYNQENIAILVGTTEESLAWSTDMQHFAINTWGNTNANVFSTYSKQDNPRVVFNKAVYSNSVITPYTYTDPDDPTSLVNRNVFLFANNMNGEAKEFMQSGFRLKRFKMIDNNVIVRDFIPCKDVQGEVGLYDLITKQFYPKQGDGILSANGLTSAFWDITDEDRREAFFVGDYKISPAKIHSTSDGKLMLEITNADFNSEQHQITQIIVNDKVYDFSPTGNHILNVEKVYNNAPIQLRVTGVTKDLRGSTAQLTVEENTLYNTLVDRLLAMLK